MTCALNHNDLGSYVGHNPPKRNAIVNKAGVLRRIFDTIYELHRRQADGEIASFFARRGGRITDDLEREMMQRLTSNWSTFK